MAKPINIDSERTDLEHNVQYIAVAAAGTEHTF